MKMIEIYSDSGFTGITISDLKAYDRLCRRFIRAFSNLGGNLGSPSRFHRKNFKPKGWFKKVGSAGKGR